MPNDTKIVGAGEVQLKYYVKLSDDFIYNRKMIDEENRQMIADVKDLSSVDCNFDSKAPDYAHITCIGETGGEKGKLNIIQLLPTCIEYLEGLCNDYQLHKIPSTLTQFKCSDVSPYAGIEMAYCKGELIDETLKKTMLMYCNNKFVGPLDQPVSDYCYDGLASWLSVKE